MIREEDKKSKKKYLKSRKSNKLFSVGNVVRIYKEQLKKRRLLLKIKSYTFYCDSVDGIWDTVSQEKYKLHSV